MSWRRFLILLRGLSSNSVLVQQMYAKKEQKIENKNIAKDAKDAQIKMTHIGW